MSVSKKLLKAFVTSGVLLGSVVSANAGDISGSERIGSTYKSVANLARQDIRNVNRPYIIVDKEGGTVHLFSSAGKESAVIPALTGEAKGDFANNKLGFDQMTKADKITPAGVFDVKYSNKQYGGATVFDFSPGDKISIAIHKYAREPGEMRLARLVSNRGTRISWGCVNVLDGDYDKYIKPNITKGSLVYVTPDDPKNIGLIESKTIRGDGVANNLSVEGAQIKGNGGSGNLGTHGSPFILPVRRRKSGDEDVVESSAPVSENPTPKKQSGSSVSESAHESYVGDVIPESKSFNGVHSEYLERVEAPKIVRPSSMSEFIEKQISGHPDLQNSGYIEFYQNNAKEIEEKINPEEIFDLELKKRKELIESNIKNIPEDKRNDFIERTLSGDITSTSYGKTISNDPITGRVREIDFRIGESQNFGAGGSVAHGNIASAFATDNLPKDLSEEQASNLVNEARAHLESFKGDPSEEVRREITHPDTSASQIIPDTTGTEPVPSPHTEPVSPTVSVEELQQAAPEVKTTPVESPRQETVFADNSASPIVPDTTNKEVSVSVEEPKAENVKPKSPIKEGSRTSAQMEERVAESEVKSALEKAKGMSFKGVGIGAALGTVVTGVHNAFTDKNEDWGYGKGAVVGAIGGGAFEVMSTVTKNTGIRFGKKGYGAIKGALSLIK